MNFKSNRYANTVFGANPDKKIDASNDGKFTFKEALKNFGKGIISPIKALIDHPLIAIGTLAATGLACFAVPALTPLLTLGFGALSLYEVGKGTYEAAKNYKNGEYDAAEKSFEKIGTGTIGTILTALGLKSSAKIAAETKLANQTGKAFTQAEKVAILEKVKNGSMFSALKENLSMITTSEGRSAFISSIKPENIIAQFKKNAPLVKPKKFEETLEGQRRANMSTRDVEREVTEVINNAFDEMGIPKKARPKIVISDELRYQTVEDANKIISNKVDSQLWCDNFKYTKGSYNKEFFNVGEKLTDMTNDEILARIKSVLSQADDTQKYATNESFLKSLLNEQKASRGGSYNSSTHEIVFYTRGWRKGSFASIDEIGVHEALHSKMAIYRNSLQKEEVVQIIKQELINRIKFGESEKVIVRGGFLGVDETMTPPKMSQNMRSEFLKFAEDFLYKSDSELSKLLNKNMTDKALEPIVTRLKTMLRNNLEFITENGGSEQKALETLLKYVESHERRFSAFSNTKIKDLEPITLSPEQHKQAVESLIGYIETIEGNSRTQGFGAQIFGPTKQEFNQYQFSYEELLARNTAAEFEKTKIQTMLKDTTLSAEKQAELTARLEKLDFLLDYNRVGKKYYDLYTKVLNNPNDTALAEELRLATAEFEKIEALKKVNPELGAIVESISWTIPYNMTPYLPKKEAA